jgi:hypothetical protein
MKQNINLIQLGFDQATNSYKYNVNTGVAAEPINGTPWRLQRHDTLLIKVLLKNLGKSCPSSF